MGQTSSKIGEETFNPQARGYVFRSKHLDARFGDVTTLEQESEGSQVLQKDFISNDARDFEHNLHRIKKRCEHNHPNLFGILGYTTKKEGTFCAEHYRISVYFENPPRTLEHEIYHRREGTESGAIYNYFPETELWYILDSLVAAGAHLETHEEAHGDISVKNIVVTEDKEYKLIDSRLLAGGTLPAYYALSEETRTEGRYVSPAIFEALGRKETKTQLLHSQSKSDVFSLGMTILHAATLQNLDYVYNWEKFEVESEKIADLLKDLTENKRYSPILLQTIHFMLNSNEELRPNFHKLDSELSTYRADIKARTLNVETHSHEQKDTLNVQGGVELTEAVIGTGDVNVTYEKQLLGQDGEANVAIHVQTHQNVHASAPENLEGELNLGGEVSLKEGAVVEGDVKPHLNVTVDVKGLEQKIETTGTAGLTGTLTAGETATSKYEAGVSGTAGTTTSTYTSKYGTTGTAGISKPTTAATGTGSTTTGTGTEQTTSKYGLSGATGISLPTTTTGTAGTAKSSYTSKYTNTTSVVTNQPTTTTGAGAGAGAGAGSEAGAESKIATDTATATSKYGGGGVTGTAGTTTSTFSSKYGTTSTAGTNEPTITAPGTGSTTKTATGAGTNAGTQQTTSKYGFSGTTGTALPTTTITGTTGTSGTTTSTYTSKYATTGTAGTNQPTTTTTTGTGAVTGTESKTATDTTKTTSKYGGGVTSTAGTTTSTYTSKYGTTGSPGTSQPTSTGAGAESKAATDTATTTSKYGGGTTGTAGTTSSTYTSKYGTTGTAGTTQPTKTETVTGSLSVASKYGVNGTTGATGTIGTATNSSITESKTATNTATTTSKYGGGALGTAGTTTSSYTSKNATTGTAGTNHPITTTTGTEAGAGAGTGSKIATDTATTTYKYGGGVSGTAGTATNTYSKYATTGTSGTTGTPEKTIESKDETKTATTASPSKYGLSIAGSAKLTSPLSNVTATAETTGTTGTTATSKYGLGGSVGVHVTVDASYNKPSQEGSSK